MWLRVVIPAAALVLLAALAVPALVTTYQTDVTMTNKSGPGTYSYVCTAGSYHNPTFIGREVFVIRGTKIVRVVPSKGGAYAPPVA